MSGINFKIYLSDEFSSFSEVRRFIPDKDIRENFAHLREKLQSVFPKLRGNNFTVYWKDNDGDAITISSNEELKIALNELSSGKVYKLYVVLHSDDNNEKPSSSKDHGTYHHNVVCDGCEGDVRGFRYKCIQCEDYDLCYRCESQGLHAEHCMIRISRPLQWPSHYNRRLMHHLRKIFKKHDSHFSKEDAKEECTKGRRHCFRPAPPLDFSSFVEALGHYVNEFTNGSGECPMKESAAKNAETQPSNSNESSGNASKEEGINNLRESLGVFKLPTEEIKRFLDPFGIDIDIQIKSDNEEKTQQKEPSKRSESQGSSSDDASSKKFPGEGKKLNDDKKDDKQDNKPSASDTTPARSQESPVKEGAEEWTIVDKNEASTISHSSSASSSLNDAAGKDAAPSAPPDSTPTNSIYPQLAPKQEKVYHANPKIQRAIETMVAMGFSNKSGLLTYLLEAEDGNISKVLDLLQPTL